MAQIAFIALLTLLLPCVGWPQELARIYMYAQRETPIRSSLLIMCDGRPVAKIKRGTFFAINIAAGRHVLSTRKGVPLFVDVPSDNESFVRIDRQIEVGESPTLVFDSVAARIARNEMRFVVYIDSKEVMSSLVPKTDPRPPPEMRLKNRDDQSSQR
jgi:hypothetical protein